MNNHEEQVKLISEQIKQYNRAGEKVSLEKAQVSHTVPTPAFDARQKNKKINIRGLSRIIEIDEKNKTCTAQAGVAFSDLVKETLKVGLIPLLVPELKTITIGGAVSGCSVESMSYRYGGFHDTCLEIEAVTPAGEIILCSPELNPGIFHMLHGSFGTIATITKIKFKLMEAKPFVRVDYHSFDNISKFTGEIEKHYRAGDVDFMDGIIHNKNKFVLCIGSFSENAPFTSDYTGINIYYKSTGYKKFDYLTTYDYLFRYDTECHWLTRNFGLENAFVRMMAKDKILGSTNIINLWKNYPMLHYLRPKADVIVDLFIPVQNFERFFFQFDKKFNYYPIWIVPYRIPKLYPWVNPDFVKGINGNLWIDFAVYGMKQSIFENSYKILEYLVYDNQGLKTLISHNYYSQENFWKIYNKARYYQVKNQTDPNNILGDIYHKTHKAK
jgi:hypothetical protein